MWRGATIVGTAVGSEAIVAFERPWCQAFEEPAQVHVVSAVPGGLREEDLAVLCREVKPLLVKCLRRRPAIGAAAREGVAGGRPG